MRASPSGKASAFQADIHGFESRRPLWRQAMVSRQQAQCVVCGPLAIFDGDCKYRARSSTAEHLAHNRLVEGSNPSGPINNPAVCGVFLWVYRANRRFPLNPLPYPYNGVLFFHRLSQIILFGIPQTFQVRIEIIIVEEANSPIGRILRMHADMPEIAGANEQTKPTA